MYRAALRWSLGVSRTSGMIILESGTPIGMSNGMDVTTCESRTATWAGGVEPLSKGKIEKRSTDQGNNRKKTAVVDGVHVSYALSVKGGSNQVK